MMVLTSLPLRNLIPAVTVLLMLACNASPAMAQSGIDTLSTGGSLGSDPSPEVTSIKQVGNDSAANGAASSSRPEYYTLGGQRIQTPRRGEVYIIRWRERGVWRKGKYIDMPKS